MQTEDVAGSIISRRMIGVLTCLMSVHCTPAYLRSNSGSEFVSRAILQWLTDARSQLPSSAQGKAWQNGANNPSRAALHDEVLEPQ